MNAPIVGLIVALSLPGLAAAQTTIIDASKPPTGKARSVFGLDGKPVDMGVPAVAPKPAPEPRSAAATPGAPVIRPAYLRPSPTTPDRNCNSASASANCANPSGNSVRIYAVSGSSRGTDANQARKVEQAKAPERSRIRIGRRGFR